MHLRLNTLLARLLIGTCIPLVLFIAVALAAVISIQRLHVALGREQHTHQVIDEMLRLRQNFSNMRLAHRGFGLADSQPLLAEYRGNQVELRGRGAALLQLVEENPAQVRRVQDILDLEARWHRIMDEARPPPPGQSRAQAEELARQYFDRVRPLTERIDSEIKQFMDAEEELLRQLRAITAEQTRQGEWLIVVAAAAGFLLALVVALRAARSVTRPVNRLREAASQLIAGRFQIVPPDGPTEVADLTVYFNHMGITLAERARNLQQQKDRYQQYLGATTQILWSTDAAGAMSGDVPTWRSFTGQSEEEVRGAGWLDAIHPDDRPATADAWAAVVRERCIFEREFRLRGAQGDFRRFACHGVPIINPDGSVREWIGTCTDVTDRERQAALRQAKEAAEASNRAKSEFLAKMSHELRTPLNAVIGMSRMLATQRFGRLNAKQADYLNDVVHAGQHLLELINDILDLSKVEAGRMDLRAECFGLGAAMGGVLSALRPLAEEKGIALETVAPAEDGELATDPARFRQVLYNLLSNAIKFTPGGGAVTVACQWVGAAEPEALPASAATATAVRVEVRDTGIGIAPENQDAIWDEFRQVKPPSVGAVEGTGLGLTLTRRLIALMGGTIWLHSAAGQGSTFSFVLPRQLPAPAPAPRGAGPSGADGGKPLTLVVEDYPATRKLLLDWLAEVGHRTTWAADGETGLELARELRPQLIILDVHLPGMDGWRVLAELKSAPETASIPVVIVSVNEEWSAAGSLEVQECFVKPLEREAFLRRLSELQPDLFDPKATLTAVVEEEEPAAREQLQ